MITIVMPFYNSRYFIKSTLESLENQKFKDFKIVFIDDGSIDGTSQYIREYFHNKNVNYEIIRTEHQGVSHARNIGLKNVNTPYFMFLDSDDYIEHDTLKIAVEVLETHKLDAVFFEYDRRLNNKTVWQYSDSYLTINGFLNGIEMLDNIFDNRVHIIISNMVYKTKLASGLKFCEQTSFHEDIHFCYRAIIRAEKIGFIPRVLVHYVVRDNSITKDLSIEKLNQGIFALESLQRHLYPIESKLAEKVIRQVIPETLLHFFKNLSLSENVINAFKRNRYLKYMKRYRMSRRNIRYFVKYVQIKWIALAPNCYVFLWRYLWRIKNKVFM